MRFSEDFINFNKEIIFGEFGAVAGAQIASYLVSNSTNSASTISTSAVIGSIIGASLFWVATRIYDKIKTSRRGFSSKRFVEDMAYFTPVAFILTSLIYYPSLYYFSEYLIKNSGHVTIPIFFSQAGAFLLLLIALNFYKYLLYKYTGREL
jgi:uncharacterized membrane protein YeaQ/YmgE (transglycosylase-associated protein family)